MPYRRTAAVQERLDATRTRIVAAAHDLIAEHGYAGCSMALVAEGAEVATGTVYRYFPDKGALFAEVFRTCTQREIDAATAAASEPAPVVVQITRAAETFAHRALAAPRLAYALLAEPVDPRVEEQRLVFRAAWRDLFAELVADGVRAGELPPQDPRVSAAGAIGALAEALVSPLSSATDGVDRAGVVPDIVRFVIRSLGAPVS